VCFFFQYQWIVLNSVGPPLKRGFMWKGSWNSCSPLSFLPHSVFKVERVIVLGH